MPKLSLPGTADMYRAVFPFGLFNALQSQCFPALVQTSDNVVSLIQMQPLGVETESTR